jgi:hypothetical protein
MGIANYTNFSELMNELLKDGLAVSISDMVREAGNRMLILASEGTPADQSDLENGFINLVDALYRLGAIRPEPASQSDFDILRLYESGKLAEKGYGGKEGDQFLEIRWVAKIDSLPVITNLNL